MACEGEQTDNELYPKKSTENYVPLMKPGDVEIPNRIFVKGFPREASEEDLIEFFEEYGQVIDCRIVADKNGYSKGFGFITFDSQNVAEKVKELEHINYNEEFELVIGPARIRKKKYYLLPPPQIMQAPAGQPMYPQENIIWATQAPQQQQQLVQISPPYQSPVPVQMQQIATSPQPYGVYYVNEPPVKQHIQPSYVTYQQCPATVNYVDKTPFPNISQLSLDDSQQGPSTSPVHCGYSVDVHHQQGADAYVHGNMVPVTVQKRVN